jgi:hypothetical protein
MIGNRRLIESDAHAPDMLEKETARPLFREFNG